MAFRAAMPSFAGGEIGRQVRARYDVAKYQTALDKGRNTLGLPGGGQYNRPGMEFGDVTHDMTRLSELFEWTFSDDQSYALEFSHETMRVFYDGAPVIEPQLLITDMTQSNPLTVTVPASGWAVGDRIYFSGVEGMTEINGRTLRITAQAGDVSTFDVDSTEWGVFTGSGGGVPGDDEGGTGGYPPPPAPGDPDPDPPDYPDTDLEEPPRCVWVEAWVSDSLRAGKVEIGDALLMMDLSGETYQGAVTGLRLARRPCLRLETVSGVVLTCSTTTPVPIRSGETISQPRAEALERGYVVAVQDANGFRWEALERVVRVEPKMVAQISAGDGIYWAGDRKGAGIFTHNIKSETVS